MSDVAVQPALPSLELPEYHGRTPTTMKSTVNGTGNRITTAHTIGDTVVLVVEAKVRKAGHLETDKDGLVYAENFKVVDMFEMAGKGGRRLLSGLRSAYRLSDDTANGRKVLPLEKTGAIVTPAGWTDENGRPLDDDELAEIRGDPVLSSLNDAGRDPVVCVLADGSRKLWPDDFGHDDFQTSRPAVGEFVGAGTVRMQIRQLLDVDTGETLGEWTDEQEDARLAALEDEARAAEAAGNREAVEALEAARGRVPGEPWPGYEGQGAREIVGLVKVLATAEEAFAVASWEEDHGGRPSIVQAAHKRAAELAGTTE